MHLHTLDSTQGMIRDQDTCTHTRQGLMHMSMMMHRGQLTPADCPVHCVDARCIYTEYTGQDTCTHATQGMMRMAMMA